MQNKSLIDIDQKKIYFFSEKKGYRISYNMSKLKFSTPIFYNHFGIENYNNKEIINIYLDTSDNEKYNFLTQIQNLENFFDNLINNTSVSKDLIKDLNNKIYYHSIKKSLNGNNFRVHLKNTDIYKMINGKKIILTKKEIVKKKCIFEIELSNLWINDFKYGLIWYVTKIEIMD